MVDKNTYHRLRQNYLFDPPTSVVVKGKGEMTAYRLIGRSGKAKSKPSPPDNVYHLDAGSAQQAR